MHLPDDLLKAAKLKAAAEGRTLTSLLEEGLRIVMADRPARRANRERVRLPVSTARGGFLPGVDPIKMATVSEGEEDAERLQEISGRR